MSNDVDQPRTWIFDIPIIMMVVVVFILAFGVTGDAAAYPNFHDPNLDGDGYCASCHTGFPGRGDTHDTHVGNSNLTGNCNLCHTGSGRNNPFIMWSTGDSSPGSNYGCTGCHGRDYGETIQLANSHDNGSSTFNLNGLPKISGYGLRKQHLVKGVTRCLDCHQDVPRSFVADEGVKPPNYLRTDVNLSDPCSSVEEDTTPELMGDDSVGLDNDGDGRTDMADPGCNAALEVTPGEAGPPCGDLPLQITAYDAGTDTLSISYGPACAATQHNIYAGPLTAADLDAANYTTALCGVGVSGSSAFTLPMNDAFFLLVPDDGTFLGSFGERSAAVPGHPQRIYLAERPADALNMCGLVHDLSTRCD